VATGFVWHERYAWHDARGLLDTFDRGALFEPEPSLESGSAKRRLRNLIDAAGLLASLTDIDPRPLEDDALKALHAGAYVDRIRTASAPRRRCRRLDAVRTLDVRTRRARRRGLRGGR
jgi:acetoin utilization deacetylase AcuC-like enzyme